MHLCYVNHEQQADANQHRHLELRNIFVGWIVLYTRTVCTAVLSTLYFGDYFYRNLLRFWFKGGMSRMYQKDAVRSDQLTVKCSLKSEYIIQML